MVRNINLQAESLSYNCSYPYVFILFSGTSNPPFVFDPKIEREEDGITARWRKLCNNNQHRPWKDLGASHLLLTTEIRQGSLSEVCGGKLALRVPYTEGLQEVLLPEQQTTASVTLLWHIHLIISFFWHEIKINTFIQKLLNGILWPTVSRYYSNIFMGYV
jgi:hypothetical protein